MASSTVVRTSVPVKRYNLDGPHDSPLTQTHLYSSISGHRMYGLFIMYRAFLKKLLFIPDDAIKIFFLPNRPNPVELFLHLVRRKGFPGMNQLLNWKIFERLRHNMNMIIHDHIGP